MESRDIDLAVRKTYPTLTKIKIYAAMESLTEKKKSYWNNPELTCLEYWNRYRYSTMYIPISRFHDQPPLRFLPLYFWDDSLLIFLSGFVLACKIILIDSDSRTARMRKFHEEWNPTSPLTYKTDLLWLQSNCWYTRILASGKYGTWPSWHTHLGRAALGLS